MAHGTGLEVSKAIRNALSHVEWSAPTVEEKTLVVLAAYFDALSSGYGLSEHKEGPLTERVEALSEFQPIVNWYLDLPEGPFDIEALRTKLYGALTEVAGPASMTLEQCARVAQVYWNLSWDQAHRPDLPFRNGPRRARTDPRGTPTTYAAVIWVEAKQSDLAELQRYPRTELLIGTGGTAGSGLRKRAAELSAMAAKNLMDRRSKQQWKSVSTDLIAKTEKGVTKFWIRVVENQGDRAGASDLVNVIRANADSSKRAGDWQQAAFAFDAIVTIMRRRSETWPADHDADLATACMEAGQASVLAGMWLAARDHFHDAVRISEMLVGMDTTSSSKRVTFAASYLLLSQAQTQLDEGLGAAASLTAAIAILDDLHATDSGDEQIRTLLVAGLAMRGQGQANLANWDSAEMDLARAERVLTGDLHQETADTDPDKLMHVWILGHWARLYVDRKQTTKAEDVLSRAVALVDALGKSDPSAPLPLRLSIMLLLGSSYTILGLSHFDDQRFTESETALASAVHCLELRDAGVAEHIPVDLQVGMDYLLILTLLSLAAAQIELDKLDESEATLNLAHPLLVKRRESHADDLVTWEFAVMFYECSEEVYAQTGRLELAENSRF